MMAIPLVAPRLPEEEQHEKSFEKPSAGPQPASDSELEKPNSVKQGLPMNLPD